MTKVKKSRLVLVSFNWYENNATNGMNARCGAFVANCRMKGEMKWNNDRELFVVGCCCSDKIVSIIIII